MRRMTAWTMIVGLGAALVAGCQENKQEPVTEAPAQEPVEKFPEAQVPAAEPQPVTAVNVPPAPPVDTSAQQPAASPAPTASAQPKESYAASPAQKSARTYTVRKGDTLQKISQKYYGTTKKWRRLFEANRKVLRDPDRLTPGMKLVIP